MNKLIAVIGVLLFLNSFKLYAQSECASGDRVYFELPFKGEVRYSASGERLPRELIGTNGRVSICHENKNSKLYKKIESSLDQIAADNVNALKILSAAQSVDLNRVFYIGNEIFAFVDLTMRKGQQIPYAIRLIIEGNELALSQLPRNKNLETSLKYLLTYNKLIDNAVSGNAIKISEPESNAVILHADLYFSDADHPVRDKVVEVNRMIDEEDYANYFKLLDARSLEKSKEFLETSEPDKKHEAAKHAFSIPTIQYIVDLKPIYFIAYDTQSVRGSVSGSYQEPSGVRFQTFYGDGNNVVPWNLYYENAITDLLTSTGFYAEVSNIKSTR